MRHVRPKIESAPMMLKRLGLLGFMIHYNVETDSTVGGNYSLHDQVEFQIDELISRRHPSRECLPLITNLKPGLS